MFILFSFLKNYTPRKIRGIFLPQPFAFTVAVVIHSNPQILEPFLLSLSSRYYFSVPQHFQKITPGQNMNIFKHTWHYLHHGYSSFLVKLLWSIILFSKRINIFEHTIHLHITPSWPLESLSLFFHSNPRLLEPLPPVFTIASASISHKSSSLHTSATMQTHGKSTSPRAAAIS